MHAVHIPQVGLGLLNRWIIVLGIMYKVGVKSHMTAVLIVSYYFLPSMDVMPADSTSNSIILNLCHSIISD